MVNFLGHLDWLRSHRERVKHDFWVCLWRRFQSDRHLHHGEDPLSPRVGGPHPVQRPEGEWKEQGRRVDLLSGPAEACPFRVGLSTPGSLAWDLDGDNSTSFHRPPAGRQPTMGLLSTGNPVSQSLPIHPFVSIHRLLVLFLGGTPTHTVPSLVHKFSLHMCHVTCYINCHLSFSEPQQSVCFYQYLLKYPNGYLSS